MATPELDLKEAIKAFLLTEGIAVNSARETRLLNACAGLIASMDTSNPWVGRMPRVRHTVLLKNGVMAGQSVSNVGGVLLRHVLVRYDDGTIGYEEAALLTVI